MRRQTRELVKKIARFLDGEPRLERFWAIRFDDEGFGYDRFGLERESFLAAYLVARAFYRRWFRVESEGHGHVPRGRAILAGNHSGLLPWDGAMVAVDMIEKLEPPRLVRAIVDHAAFHWPYLSTFMARTGQVSGTSRNFVDLLRRESLVLVFPEGARGIVKPFRERYRLRPFNVGFVEVALEQEAPVVPFAVLGAEEQAPVLFTSRFLGERLGLPALPVTPTFPLLGPLGLLPYPVKYRIVYGEPMAFHREYPKEAACHPEVVHTLAERVRTQVQAIVDRELASAGGRRAKGAGFTRTGTMFLPGARGPQNGSARTATPAVDSGLAQGEPLARDERDLGS